MNARSRTTAAALHRVVALALVVEVGSAQQHDRGEDHQPVRQSEREIVDHGRGVLMTGAIDAARLTRRKLGMAFFRAKRPPANGKPAVARSTTYADQRKTYAALKSETPDPAATGSSACNPNLADGQSGHIIAAASRIAGTLSLRFGGAA